MSELVSSSCFAPLIRPSRDLLALVYTLLRDTWLYLTSWSAPLQVFMPAFPFAALCLAATPVLAPPLQIGLGVATALTCMSQQFHAWAHTKARRLPGPVIALQVRSGGCSELGLPKANILMHASAVDRAQFRAYGTASSC